MTIPIHRAWLRGIILLALIAVGLNAVAAEPKLVAAFFVKGKVGLKWQMMEGVDQYLVYRKAPGGEFTKIATTDEDHYFDVDVSAGSTYTYKIAVVGAGGAEVHSAERSVAIPGEVGDFKAPTWVGLRIDQDKILLNWDPVPSAIAYNVFRSTTPGGEYEVIGNTQASRFSDKNNLEKGQTYYYVLSALNAEFDETEQSDEQSIKFGISRAEEDRIRAEQSKVNLEEVKLTRLFDITETAQRSPLNQPADVFVNSRGQIYVTDALNAKVHCFDDKGNHQFSFGEKIQSRDPKDRPDAGFILPFSLHIDQKDQVYVGDVNRHDIQVFTASGEFVRRIQVDTGEGMEELRPNGIHVLNDGRIVMTDSGNHRFLIVDASGKILLSVGERGGEPGQFIFPDGLTVSADNTVCIVDVINCRIQQFDLKGNFIRAFGGVGQSAGTFARPKAISVDEQGRIWVSDGMSNMLQCFTMEGEVKSAVGKTDDAVQFTTPRGMFFKDGRFYVVNRLRNQVVVYSIG